MSIRLRAMSREEVRRLDVQATELLGLPTSLLMENAGRGAAAWLGELIRAISPYTGGRPFSSSFSKDLGDIQRGLTFPKILILAGPGNNGGDGGVVARHLDAWGLSVEIVWFAHSGQLRGDALLQWTILEKSRIKQSAWFDKHSPDLDLDLSGLATIISEAEWLVDGLLGTGLSRPVNEPLRSVIELVNNSGKPVLALDLPSGLDTDSGEPLSIAVRATATATFVATKLGFNTPGAVNFTGEVTVIDIGLPSCVLEPFRDS